MFTVLIILNSELMQIPWQRMWPLQCQPAPQIGAVNCTSVAAHFAVRPGYYNGLMTPSKALAATATFHRSLETPSSRTLVPRLLRVRDTTTIQWLLDMYRKSVGLLVAGGGDSTEDTSQSLFFVDTRGKRTATDPKRLRIDAKDDSIDAPGDASDGKQEEQQWHDRAATVISGLGDEAEVDED